MRILRVIVAYEMAPGESMSSVEAKIREKLADPDRKIDITFEGKQPQHTQMSRRRHRPQEQQH